MCSRSCSSSVVGNRAIHLLSQRIVSSHWRGSSLASGFGRVISRVYSCGVQYGRSRQSMRVKRGPHNPRRSWSRASKAPFRFNRDFMDDYPICVNIRAFRSSCKTDLRGADRHGCLGQPEQWQRSRSGNSPWHLEPRFLSVVLEPMTNARLAINSDADFD